MLPQSIVLPTMFVLEILYWKTPEKKNWWIGLSSSQLFLWGCQLLTANHRISQKCMILCMQSGLGLGSQVMVLWLVDSKKVVWTLHISVCLSVNQSYSIVAYRVEGQASLDMNLVFIIHLALGKLFKLSMPLLLYPHYGDIRTHHRDLLVYQWEDTCDVPVFSVKHC